MLLRIKIQTAIIIVLVFAFRLFYANVCISECPQNSKTCQFTSSHFKSFIKKRRKAEETVISNQVKASAGQEVFEETRDNEEEPLKADAPVILSYLYSPLYENVIGCGLGNPSGHLSYSLLPKKYLAFSILRI
ncbi:MAG: hypothetical protein ACXVC6_00380 [Bacteroidia bacterium]